MPTSPSLPLSNHIPQDPPPPKVSNYFWRATFATGASLNNAKDLTLKGLYYSGHLLLSAAQNIGKAMHNNEVHAHTAFEELRSKTAQEATKVTHKIHQNSRPIAQASLQIGSTALIGAYLGGPVGAGALVTTSVLSTLLINSLQDSSKESHSNDKLHSDKSEAHRKTTSIHPRALCQLSLTLLYIGSAFAQLNYGQAKQLIHAGEYTEAIENLSHDLAIRLLLVPIVARTASYALYQIAQSSLRQLNIKIHKGYPQALARGISFSLTPTSLLQSPHFFQTFLFPAGFPMANCELISSNQAILLKNLTDGELLLEQTALQNFQPHGNEIIAFSSSNETFQSELFSLAEDLFSDFGDFSLNHTQGFHCLDPSIEGSKVNALCSEYRYHNPMKPLSNFLAISIAQTLVDRSPSCQSIQIMLDSQIFSFNISSHLQNQGDQTTLYLINDHHFNLSNFRIFSPDNSTRESCNFLLNFPESAMGTHRNETHAFWTTHEDATGSLYYYQNISDENDFLSSTILFPSESILNSFSSEILPSVTPTLHTDSQYLTFLISSCLLTTSTVIVVLSASLACYIYKRNKSGKLTIEQKNIEEFKLFSPTDPQSTPIIIIHNKNPFPSAKQIESSLASQESSLNERTGKQFQLQTFALKKTVLQHNITQAIEELNDEKEKISDKLVDIKELAEKYSNKEEKQIYLAEIPRLDLKPLSNRREKPKKQSLESKLSYTQREVERKKEILDEHQTRLTQAQAYSTQLQTLFDKTKEEIDGDTPPQPPEQKEVLDDPILVPLDLPPLEEYQYLIQRIQTLHENLMKSHDVANQSMQHTDISKLSKIATSLRDEMEISALNLLKRNKDNKKISSLKEHKQLIDLCQEAQSSRQEATKLIRTYKTNQKSRPQK